MTSSTYPRRGFSLIEVMCVMVLIAVLGSALAIIMNETLLAERLQAQSYERLQQSRALADQFRADVALAVTAPQKWRDHEAGPDTLILKMKNNDHVLYRWRDGALKRLVTEDDEDTERTLPVGNQTSVEFVRHGADSKVLRVRLNTVRAGKTASGQALEIAAALGGDWR